MTADELKALKKIRSNLGHYQLHYYGSGPNKRDEVFLLLKQLIKGKTAQLDRAEFNRGYRAALVAARQSAEHLVRELDEMKVPPLAWKGDDE